MIREPFSGHRPSHFGFNPFVKSLIISETFLWSAWNFVIPIFSIFVATQITGGNIQIASFAFSFYLIARVVIELIASVFLTKANDRQKVFVTMIGNFLLSVAYIGFALTKTVPPIFVFYVVAGMGLGLAAPAKNSLFSTHLDKNKEPEEWGIHDALIFIGMALAASLGGLIASDYGFSTVFVLAAVVNLISLIPYLLYLK